MGDRAGTAHASRSSHWSIEHGRWSRCGRWPGWNLLPADRLLADADPRRVGAGDASGLFSVRNAGRQHARRAELGATTKTWAAGVAQSIRRSHWSVVGAGMAAGLAIALVARRSSIGQSVRCSSVACRELVDDRDGVFRGRLDSRAARGSRRSGHHAPAGVEQRFANHSVRRRDAAHHGSVRLVKARPLSAAGVSPPVQIITPSLS